MCRPLHVSLREPFTGGHIGPPLHNAGSVPEPTRIGVKRTLRGEAEPVPYRCITGRAQRTGRCGHRPLRRRSRLAARRMAEAREETGERHAGSSCPTGESPGRDAPSWFPALAPERIEIIFRRGVYVAKNTSQAASVENGRPNGAAILCAQSACAFIRPRQLCCLGRGNLSLKCSSVHFSDLKSP